MRSVLTLAVIAWFLAAPAAAAPKKDPVEPSESCGICHKTIYQTWKGSAHAESLENDVFLQAYRELEGRAGEKQARVCLDCHAPLAGITGDHNLEYRITWEGVNCEACHGLASVDLSGSGPRMVLRPGPVKRGPIRGASTVAHEVAYSELHTKSLVCAPCHEYVNTEGTPILTTYTEWKESSSAEEGKTCQTCHMGLTETEVVDPRLDREPGAGINLHEVPGGHSLDQLHEALGLSLDSERDGDDLQLTVRIRNKGAGHAVPTGMPGRKVILELSIATSDGKRFEESRIFGKTYTDAKGKRITRDQDYFARGVELDADTRIQADESRDEVFLFPVNRDATAYLTVKLHYEHTPTGGEEGRTRLTFVSEKSMLAP